MVRTRYEQNGDARWGLRKHVRTSDYPVILLLVADRHQTDSRFPRVLEVALDGGLRESLFSLTRMNGLECSFYRRARRIIELQAFIARLVREFQFSEVEGKPITMWRPGLVVPTVEGEEDKGPQLPLRVSAVRRN